MENIYQENGYKNRREYLETLGEDYGVSSGTVFAIASLYGPGEDFDGLVTALEDLEGGGFKMTEYIIELPFQGIIQTTIKDGKLLYSEGESFEEYKAKNPGKNLVIWTEKELDYQMKIYLDSLCNKWREISEEEYWDMLECLPPVKFDGGSFFMSEMHMAYVTAYFTKRGDKYYTSLQCIYDSHKEIRQRLLSYLNEAEGVKCK